MVRQLPRKLIGVTLAAGLFLTLGCAASSRGQPSALYTRPAVTEAVTGDLRIHTFASRVFGNTRKLRVLVPEGYEDTANRARRYPVLYLNDGQDLFDPSTSLFNSMEWRVDETVRALVKAGEIPPLIVVGIDSAGKQLRPREYLPWADKYLTPPEPSPQGRRYPDFLIKEVMPFINRIYRTLIDAEHTGLGGSSYGGLTSLYTAVARPGVVGRLLLESPSLYVDDNHALLLAAKATSWPARVYLGIGTNELSRPDCGRDDQDNIEAVDNVRNLTGLIQQARAAPARVHLVIDDCAVHNEAAWAKRLPEALRFLFGR